MNKKYLATKALVKSLNIKPCKSNLQIFIFCQLKDLREQADRVEEAISRRIAETEEATRSLEAELKQVSDCFRKPKVYSTSTC